MNKKVVLAFSGGLDTSFCIPYLIDQGYEVHTLFVNTGGISPKEECAITNRAKELGAKKHININVEKSLWSEILIPLVQSGALYQNKYPALCSDRYLIVNPFFHTFGYKAGWLAALMRGVTAYPCPIFDADKIIQTINKEKISMLPGPPTLYQSILTSQLIETMDISSLRLGVTGAASIPIQLIKDMKETLGFETVITAYGLTESTGVVTMCTPNDDYETIATTSGCAIADVEVKCVDQNNKVVPAGEPGEILVRGYNITQGYFNNLEATQEAIDTDGWLHTGDIGILDSNGYIKITDRSKDMFIVGGFNAYPAEIENILCDHPAISQAAVIGIEDERMGEVAKAFVLLKPNQDLDADSLLQWSKDNMANYKVPREVEFVRELPTNAAGKIMKYLLKDES